MARVRAGEYFVVGGWALKLPSPHYSSNIILRKHTFLSGSKKEARVIKGFWQGTEIGVGFIEGVTEGEGEFALAFLGNGYSKLFVIILTHQVHNRFHYIS